MSVSPSARQMRVVIAGGGIAATETVLALRALAGQTVDITMVAPSDHLHYRPFTLVEPFASRATRHYPLRGICEDLGVTLVPDMLVRVDEAAHDLLTVGGTRIAYDALVIATGARASAALQHAHTFFADADPERLQRIVGELQQGLVRRVAFVLPVRTYLAAAAVRAGADDGRTRARGGRRGHRVDDRDSRGHAARALPWRRQRRRR